MFQAQEIIALLTSALGTEVTTVYTPGAKLKALTYAIDEVIKLEKPEESYAPDATLTFTGRKAEIPTDYLGWVKMWNPLSPGQEYFRVPINEFDTASGGQWTIKKHATELDANNNPKEYIYISDDTASAAFRYAKSLGSITSLTQWINLPNAYKYALAFFSAFRLLSDDRQYSDAGEKYQQGMDLLRRARADVQKEQKHPQTDRMESFFESENLFDPDQS